MLKGLPGEHPLQTLEEAGCVTKKPKSLTEKKKKKKDNVKSEMGKKEDILIVGQTECLSSWDQSPGSPRTVREDLNASH